MTSATPNIASAFQPPLPAPWMLSSASAQRWDRMSALACSACSNAGYTALYTAYVTSIRCAIPEYKFKLDKLIDILMRDKRENPSNYCLFVMSEGAEWEGYRLREYGEADAYGHRKKANVAEDLSDVIKKHTGEETVVS